MNPLASSRCHEGPNRLTFPDILSDPLVRAMMAADHVDPNALKLDLERIATRIQRRPCRMLHGLLSVETACKRRSRAAPTGLRKAQILTAESRNCRFAFVPFRPLCK